MKNLLLALFVCFSLYTSAQQAEQVKKLIAEGIELHDKGDYEEAIKKYDEALKLDKNDFDAHYEKALSCMYAKKYDECIELCEFMVDKFSDHPSIKQVYSNWGSALDDKGKTKEAIKAYDKGLKKFPSYYLLHFNKGLTYMRNKQYEEAVKCYMAALKDNPLHPSSNFYLGVLLQENNRIASLLSYAFFIACEPKSKRSIQAHEAIQEIVYRNIKKEGNNTNISISMDMLENMNKKKGENDFSSAEFTFSLLGAMDNSKDIDSIAKTAADKFDFKLQLLINSLKDDKKEMKGFYWEHYVPLFQEMKAKNFTSVLSNLIYLSKDIGAQLWVEKNDEKVDAFYAWVKERTWN